MKKNKSHHLLMWLMLTSTSIFAQQISLPGELLFKYARPAPKGLGTCGGSQLTFTTPPLGNSVSVSFNFTEGSFASLACLGAANGSAVSFSNVCINGTNAKPSTLYCVDNSGIDNLSTLAAADNLATCVQLIDNGGAPGSVAAANVTCAGTGSCTYTTSSAGSTLSSASAC